MAKLYAHKHGTSVSATFARIIRTLAAEEQNRTVKVPSGSALEKLAGILKMQEGQTADDLRLEALVEKYGLEEELKEAK
jgi:hypothetical protein